MPPPDATSPPRWRSLFGPIQPDAPDSEANDPSADEASFRAILEALPDPLVVVAGLPDQRSTRRVVFANAAAQRLFRAAAPGARLTAAIRRPEILEAVDESLFGASGEAAFQDGERQWSVRTRPAGELPGGERLAMIAMRDETELHAADRTRADFLANASHELRTPLASLSGFIETLRGHARDDAGAREKFLGIMQAQAERMARLIDDLLSLSRIELNEHIAPAGRVDLALAATDVVDALVPLVREKTVTLSPSLPPRGQAVVEGDRDQIVQVAQNLVENAVKYAPIGGTVRIEVSIAESIESALKPRDPKAVRFVLVEPARGDVVRYAALRIADDGPGIPRDRLPRLTERFYRVEGQKSGERSGTGLGLAIVKHIVNRHRGALMVESREGHGTAFTACFRLTSKP
ncbi:two-component system phosphate regulon sensor histidine kinase PhoR [Caulobacter ginsengisoli]|uniref:histidine kinase n=1 Tax=Caulobacter ginsengisoli TaxID=400775 RepID=A0ABU0J072_9CAUL|nr:ATP-binding protein [Caulobacter ginsengisoli]MDQ0466607.1 two-component system phosphate regulon sensor histidine kinase PhoR [Caulobacter ginsengisoli]